MNRYRRKKMLVVDDDVQIADLIAEFCEFFWISTRVLSGGKNVLDVVKSYRPDLDTLDVLMPGVSGLEILSALKSDDETRSVPILIISAAYDSEIVGDCRLAQ